MSAATNNPLPVLPKRALESSDMSRVKTRIDIDVGSGTPPRPTKSAKPLHLLPPKRDSLGMV